MQVLVLSLVESTVQSSCDVSDDTLLDVDQSRVSSSLLILSHYLFDYHLSHYLNSQIPIIIQ